MSLKSQRPALCKVRSIVFSGRSSWVVLSCVGSAGVESETWSCAALFRVGSTGVVSETWSGVGLSGVVLGKLLRILLVRAVTLSIQGLISGPRQRGNLVVWPCQVRLLFQAGLGMFPSRYHFLVVSKSLPGVLTGEGFNWRGFCGCRAVVASGASCPRGCRAIPSGRQARWFRGFDRAARHGRYRPSVCGRREVQRAVRSR